MFLWSTGPYPEPNQWSPQRPILSLFKIHFNITHPPTSWSSLLSLSFWLSHQFPTCIPLRPHSCYFPIPISSFLTWWTDLNPLLLYVGHLKVTDVQNDHHQHHFRVDDGFSRVYQIPLFSLIKRFLNLMVLSTDTNIVYLTVLEYIIIPFCYSLFSAEDLLSTRQCTAAEPHRHGNFSRWDIPEKCIGLIGGAEYPSRSPDLTNIFRVLTVGSSKEHCVCTALPETRNWMCLRCCSTSNNVRRIPLSSVPLLTMHWCRRW
jgi:hypothetical protein